MPTTPDALADRFRDVLGDTGTFVVTETGTPVLDTLPPTGGSGDTTSTPQARTPVGATITVSGVTGGFALTVYTGNPDNEIGCDDPAVCSVTQLDDGSTLYTDTTELAGPDGGTTHHVVLIHPGRRHPGHARQRPTLPQGSQRPDRPTPATRHDPDHRDPHLRTLVNEPQPLWHNHRGQAELQHHAARPAHRASRSR